MAGSRGTWEDAPSTEPLAALLVRIHAGEREALGELYDRCGRELFGLALWRSGSREDAADAVHDVFVHLIRTGASLARVRNPRSYLLAATHRAVVDIARRRRRQTLLDEDLLEPVTEDHQSKLDAAGLSRLLVRLSPRQREAVYLRHYGGLSFREIGDATGVPTFTAASRYRLGIARLRVLMGVER